MIIPTDKHLLGSVEFHDPVKETVFLSKPFWNSFFPIFLGDMERERGVVMTSEKKTKIAMDVKKAFYNYWNVKFQHGKDPSIDLYQSFLGIFDKYSNVAPVQMATCTIDTDSLPVRELDFVDDLVNDYAHMDFDSRIELEMMSDFERYGAQYLCHDSAVDKIRSDYSDGKLNRFQMQDSSLQSRLSFSYRVSEGYQYDGNNFGPVTVWNCLKVKDGLADMLKDFPLARYHSMHKQYSENLIFRRLTRRIGYDLCQMIYERFLKDGVFSFKNQYEYVLCSLILFDIYKRGTFNMGRTTARVGFISLSEMVKPFSPMFVDGSKPSLGSRMKDYDSVHKEADSKFSSFSSGDVKRVGIDVQSKSQRLSLFSDNKKSSVSSFGQKDQRTTSVFGQKDNSSSSTFGFGVRK